MRLKPQFNPHPAKIILGDRAIAIADASVQGGACVIDTPGMRTLHVSAVDAGLDMLFAEVTELAPKCRFRDCTHAQEPGCAVQAAVAAGDLSAARLERWCKLRAENRANTSVLSDPRGNKTPNARGRRR